jgi:hypothetical protein
MAKKTLSAIGVANARGDLVLSKGQASFHTLIEKIEARRVVLAEWEAFGIDFRRRYRDELVPLRTQLDATRVRWLQRLDQAHDTKGLTKGERRAIGELIVLVATDLLTSGDDPVVAELQRRYGGSSDDDPASTVATGASPRALSDASDWESQERMREQARAQYHANRSKKPKRGAANERARAEDADVHLSIREVYRKLASALHPDREPDPVERERKAALMQRVNKGYASRSLLELLEIQLELEHIDQASLASLSDSRLKHWNTILKEQLRRLDDELAEVESEYRAMVGMAPHESVSPRTVKRALTSDITRLRESTIDFERDLRVFDDIDRLKPWLKEVIDSLP